MYYWKPRLWSLRGASYWRHHPTENISTHVRPLEKIYFRWLFMYAEFEINNNKETHPTPNAERISR